MANNIDAERLKKALNCLAYGWSKACDGCPYFRQEDESCEFNRIALNARVTISTLQGNYTRLMNRMAILQSRYLPRLYESFEVKRIGKDNADLVTDEVVWFENMNLKHAFPAKPLYNFHPEYGNEVGAKMCYFYTLGTDYQLSTEWDDYGKTWRCWTVKPMPEQLGATEEVPFC